MIKRLMTFTLVLGLTLAAVGGVLAAPVQQGQPTDDLTTLARYAPESTELFGAIRTDEAYFDQIDAIVNNVLGKLPAEAAPEAFSLRAVLDQQLTGVSFTEDLRPLLGASAATYIPSISDSLLTGGGDNPLYVLFQITDAAGVESLLDDGLASDLESGDYTKSTTDGDNILYAANSSSASSVLLTDDALVILPAGVTTLSNVVTGEDAPSLNSAAAFADTMASMPADGYNFITYLNPAGIIQTVAQFMPMMAGPEFNFDGQAAAEQIGALALGGFIVEDRSLVLDAASTGPAFQDASQPIDTALLSRVPADTPLLIQGSGLGSDMITLLEGLREADARLQQNEDYANLGLLNLNSLATFIELNFEGTTGLDFQEAMSALDGDFLNYITMDYDAENETFSFGFDTLVTSGDPEVTGQILEAMAETAQAIFNPATFSDGRLDVPLGALFSMPDVLTITSAITDEFLVSGSPDDVDFALEPSGDAISDTERFSFEAGQFLPNATSLWYIDVGPLRDLLGGFLEAQGENLDETTRGDLNDLGTLLELLDTSAITTANTETGGVLRATLTLGN